MPHSLFRLHKATGWILMVILVACDGNFPERSITAPDGSPSFATTSTGIVVSNLTAASGQTYQVIESGLAPGDSAYTDRDFRYGTVPDLVRGQTYIRTANKDRTSTGDDSFLSFTIDREAIVYVAYDTPATLPAWLANGFTDTGETVSIEWPTWSNRFSLFAKKFPAGEVVLGSNREVDDQGAMYIVIVKPGPNQAPVADAGGPYSGTTGTVIRFDGSGSSDPDLDTPLSYAWDFGDEATGTGEKPTHTYAQAGSYTVSLVVTDTLGASSVPATTTTVEILETSSLGTLQVDGGKSYTCALRSTGVVECWGLNDYGQAPATKSAASGTFTQVSAHKKHSCALRTDGVVECWGLNDYGRAPATKSAATGTFTQVGVGGDFSCALRSDAAVECWGGNGYGQRDSIPTGTFTQIAVGDDHICALRDDGTATCWGQLIMKNKRAASGRYVDLTTGMDSGDDHTCALRTDGVVECWFLDKHGQAPPIKRAASGSFIQVATGAWHSCALRDDGVVECWGKNDLNQAPATKRAQRGRFTSVHRGGGYDYTCALRDDDAFECWGYNNYGQAKSEQRIVFTSTPPDPARVGGTYKVSAEGGGSGKAVTFSSLTTDVCTVSSSTVTFVATGTCTVAADQAGNWRHFAAPRVTQRFSVQ